MTEIIQIAGQYGAMGLTLLASFWYINKKDSEYKIERDVRAELMGKMHSEAIEVIEKNSIAISELSTIIKSK
jgi:hypothetical protein